MKIERDIDEDDRREAIDQRRQRRRRTIYRSYDSWKTDSGEDEDGQKERCRWIDKSLAECLKKRKEEDDQ